MRPPRTFALLLALGTTDAWRLTIRRSTGTTWPTLERTIIRGS